MTLHHNDYVSYYDRNGNFEGRGKIVGVHKIVQGDVIYDIQPSREFSMASRICGIPPARIRKHYVAPYMVDTEPKHILDEV